MGTVFQVPWTFLVNENADDHQVNIKLLQNSVLKTAAMALKTDSVSIDDTVLASYEKLAIVLAQKGKDLKMPPLQL